MNNTITLITAEMLRKEYACERELEIFEKHWPDGARVILPSLRKALRLGLCVGWVGAVLMTNQRARNDFLKKTDELHDQFMSDTIDLDEHNDQLAVAFVKAWRATDE